MDDTLLASYLLGELSMEEQAAVEAWVNNSPENRQYLEGFTNTWAKLSAGKVDTSVIDETEEWAKFKEKVDDIAEPKLIRMRLLKVAAAVLLLAAVGYFVTMLLGNQEARSTLQAGTAVKKETLPDGSVITLNKNASLSYSSSFGEKDRQVELQGEAFFSVAHDQQKPFMVKMGTLRVKVVGTSFNIKRLAATTEIVVETGIVQVLKADGMIELHPGEKAIAFEGKPLLVKEPVQDSLYNYYRTNRFVCRGTPLWKLVEMLNEAYGSSVIIANEKIREYPVSGSYSGSSLPDIIDVIVHTLQIKSDKKGNEIILY